MADRAGRHVIRDLSGGRNGYDVAIAFSENDRECADAVNVDFYKSKLGNKRGGMSALSLTFSAGGPFTGVISSAFRHVPTTAETAAELWLFDDAGIVGRLAGATTFTAPTFKDAPTGNAWDITAASINGKLFLAYLSAVDRLHCWDPVSNQVRRTGMAVMALPTVANTGSGSYAAVQRWYRTRATEQRSSVTVRRSEPSASSAAFTPSGSGTGAVVTQGTVPNELETHWEVEGSIDNVTFYRLATVAIGTTTYTDSAAPSTYNTNTLSAATGTYALQSSYKFIAADQNRLLGFGNWTSTNKQARVEVSAVIGALNVGDEERIDTTTNYFIDLDENDSGVATGLKGPALGNYFAFKDRQVWQLTPTGSVSAPYRQTPLSKSIGAIAAMGIVIAEDATGNVTIDWMSHRGPYRWGIGGLEYLGRNIEDYVLGGNATINLAATKVTARMVYYYDKRQEWLWFATGSANDPTVCFFRDVQSEGWTRVPTGDLLANVRCVCLFSNTVAASMSRDLKPYVGQTGAAARFWKCDTGTDDNGTLFQAYVLTKAAEPGGAGFSGAVGDAVLLAKAASGVTITDTVTADFGLQTRTGTALLTAAGSETRVSKRIEDSGFAGVQFVQHQLGDAAAISNAWTLDRLVVPWTRQEAVSG